MTYCNQNFNVLGKVDGAKTIVTPDHVYFRMKEATFLNDPDYHKIKTHGAAGCSMPPPPPTFTKAELEAIEREKDRQFQLLFNTLWPNIHNKLEDKTTAQKLAAEMEKTKALNDLLLKQEIEKIEKKKKEEEEKLKREAAVKAAAAAFAHSTCPLAVATCPSLPTCYSSVYTPKLHDTVNISINGLTSAKGPQVEINMPKTTGDFTHHHAAAASKDLKCHHCHHLPHHNTWTYSVSSYDLPSKKPSPPCCHHHHHTSSLTSTKELLETRERELQKQKMEKTNHLVDSLVGEVKSLQTDLRRKSVELKMKEIEMAKKEAELRKSRESSPVACCRRRLSVSFKDDCPPSPGRVSVTQSCHSSSCHLNKSESSESLTDSSDCRRRSKSPCRKAKVKSILRVRSRSPSVGRSSDSSSSNSSSHHYHHHHHPHHHHSSSGTVLPKVDSWNKNMIDHKVY